MNIAIDISFASIAIAIILRYTLRGFVRSFFGSIKLVAAAVTSFIITPILLEIFNLELAAAVYLIVFVVAYIAIHVAIRLIDKIFKLPVLNLLNKVLGFALGVVNAYIILSVAAAIITAVLGLFGEALVGQESQLICDTTYIYKFFSEFGIFSLIG